MKEAESNQDSDFTGNGGRSRRRLGSECFMCQKDIVDDKWFCRLPQKSDGADDPKPIKILLCSPACALRYFSSSHTNGDGCEQNSDRYEHSLHFLVDGEKPS